MWRRLALCTLLLFPAGAVAEELFVFIDSPEPAPVMGIVEVAARVEPLAEVQRVEFWLDGEKRGEVTGPPFRLSLDLGDQNLVHRFEVRAIDLAGVATSAYVVTPAIRVDMEVDVELQQLYVTASDDTGRALDLMQSNFEIVDDGLRQKIVTFARGDVPMAAAVLVDASASMRGRRLRFAARGATAFANETRATDEVSLQLFSDRLLFASPFDSDLDEHSVALTEVRAKGGTALNDHLYRALKQLEARQGRRVVVLLSDGFDSHSALEIEEVAWLARRSRSMLYWIRLDFGLGDASRYSAWKGPDDYRRQIAQLTRIVDELGGRVVLLDRIEDTEAAMREVVAELREQYVLGYYPTIARGDGRWHKVRVRIDRPGLTVRNRGGYLDH